MGSREELEADIAEVEQLLRNTIRPNVKELLSSNIETLRKQIAAIPVKPQAEEESKSGPASENRIYISVKNFSWDQEGKKLSVYVTSLPGTKNLEKSNIELSHDDNTIDLKLHNLEGKNYHLRFNNLFAAIASV